MTTLPSLLTPEYDNSLSMLGKVRRNRENFYIDLGWKGERVRLFSDRDGNPIYSERQAQRLLEVINAEIDLEKKGLGHFDPRNYIKRELKALRWNNYLDAWVERQVTRREAGEISREYLRMIQSLCKHHIKAMFGQRSIRDLTKGIIDDAFTNLSAHLSTKTKYNIQGIVSKVLRDAFDREDIAKLPRMTRIKVADPRTTYLEEDDQERVLTEVHNPMMKVFFQFCMMHGCRPGEARALKWEDIDWDRQTVEIHAAMDQDEYRPSTKEKNVRTIPLHPDMVAALRRFPRAISGYVFSLKGKPLRKEYVNAVWRRARKKAGLTVTCYEGTRHSLISQLLNEGYSEALVRQIAGHKCESTIQRYRHIKAESLRPLIEREKVVEIRRKVK